MRTIRDHVISAAESNGWQEVIYSTAGLGEIRYERRVPAEERTERLIIRFDGYGSILEVFHARDHLQAVQWDGGAADKLHWALTHLNYRHPSLERNHR